nr:hypothetical protein [Tanacetum cinerariifolium]
IIYVNNLTTTIQDMRFSLKE